MNPTNSVEGSSFGPLKPDSTDRGEGGRLAKAAALKGIDDCRVYIVGSQQLLNGLMANHIREVTGINCLVCSIVDLNQKVNGHADSGRGLVLLDCHREDPSRLRSDLYERALIATSNLKFCLFNVSPCKDMVIEQEAFRHGIRGIFYQTDPQPILIKGILAVLAGELWFSREALTHCLLNQQTPSHREGDGGPGDASLTLREREILIMIASGLTNDEIAGQLNLSNHTIKTHAYNIYKKIKVPNRIQASLWVAQYLA
jgi:DNA-binding NarL/FixJ family response regulator